MSNNNSGYTEVGNARVSNNNTYDILVHNKYDFIIKCLDEIEAHIQKAAKQQTQRGGRDPMPLPVDVQIRRQRDEQIYKLSYCLEKISDMVNNAEIISQNGGMTNKKKTLKSKKK